MPEHTQQLRERLAEIQDVNSAAGLLEWDQQTMMPPRGAELRAEALGTLARISHDLFVATETGRLLEAASTEVNGDGGSDDARLIRRVRRQWDKATKVPTELATELARAGSIGQEAWAAARREDDFGAFAPYLERNLELARRYADCFDGFEVPYDALLDDYQPQMTAAEVGALFDRLKAELVPLIAATSAHPVDDSVLHVPVPIEAQRRLVDEIVELMGFDREGWRLDDTVHPFATSFGVGDVRITTRWNEGYFPLSLFGAMHETGHGLYEAGIDAVLQRSPLGHVDSLGMHESQSRLWENMVGRGRSFSTVLAPRIAELFGAEFAGLDRETLFRALNRVSPSLIRIEADEATYGLHIVIRFELEQELLHGQLSVAELPEAWNARMEEYLGIEVPTNADGVLQDVHWSAGLIGYFPTYALGNMIAGQLWARVHAEIPDLEEQIAAGELGGLRTWLTENIHRHGSRYTTEELLERVVGGPIAVEPFVAYLKDKLGDAYGVALT
jgi:carboxypeptidase Taq